MNGQKSQAKVSSQSISAITTAATSSDAIQHRQRMAHNYILIWVDSNVAASKEDYQHVLEELQHIVYDVRIFAERDEAIDYITEHEEMKVFLLLTADIGQHILTIINDIQQIDSIYILCDNNSQIEGWTMNSSKIRSVHTDIKSIYQALQASVKQCNQDSISVSFIDANEGTSQRNLNQLEPSFMYTQIFKEILLTMQHDKKSLDAFITIWRQHYTNNPIILRTITEFERDYCPQFSIWWYTREYFIYQMLNQSLRTLDSPAIINMGFFIQDLHKEIEQLHQKQVTNYRGKTFTVYRGQGLSILDFEKLRQSKGGLMSFNNFLSTSTNRGVSLSFAMGSLGKMDTVGILFKMTIDPSKSYTPFASIGEVGFFKNEEEEILFSMHTVFRISEINEIENNNSLYQVDLTLTTDNDEQLHALTKWIREEVADEIGWKRLCNLLRQLQQWNKAEELYNIFFEPTSHLSDKSLYCNNLAYIKAKQGEYEKAIEFYEKSLEIRRKTLPPNHPDVASSYNNIAVVYCNMGEYSKALSFCEKSLDIDQKTLPPNQPSLATSYNNTAGVYHNMGEYSKALSFYEKSLEIRRKTLPPNHPDVASSYHNIAVVYHNMGECLKALSFYEKSLQIYQKTLPPNHPSLATSYNNIAEVYSNMGEYSKALSFYEKSLEIYQKTLPPNHPDVATSYNNIGAVYR